MTEDGPRFPQMCGHGAGFHPAPIKRCMNVKSAKETYKGDAIAAVSRLRPRPREAVVPDLAKPLFRRENWCCQTGLNSAPGGEI